MKKIQSRIIFKNVNKIAILFITLNLFPFFTGLSPLKVSAASQNVNIPLTLPPNATDDPSLSTTGSGDHIFTDWSTLRLTIFQAETASNKEAEALTTRLTLGSSGICQGAKFQSLSVSFHVGDTVLGVGANSEQIFSGIYDVSTQTTIAPTPGTATSAMSGLNLVSVEKEEDALASYSVDLSSLPAYNGTNINLGLITMFDENNATEAFDTVTDIAVKLTYDDSGCFVPLSTEPDIFSTPAGASITINVLGNDGGSNLTISKIDSQNIVVGQTITLSNGSGTVKLNPDGTITFTPAVGFFGESLFSYSITDGSSTVDTGVVRVAVVEDITSNTSNTENIKLANSTNTLAKSGQNKTALITISILMIVLSIVYINKHQ